MLGFEWLAWCFGIFEKQGFKDFYYDLIIVIFNYWIIIFWKYFGRVFDE